MRIGVLTTSYPRHDGDYAGCFVGDRVQGLLAAGHAVDVLAAGDAAAAIGATARDGALSVTRVAAEPALFYGAGAPEALERGGAAAWLAAARFSTALAATAAARCDGWDAIEAHWLVPCALAAQAAAPAHHARAYVHSGDVALLERMPLGRAIARRLARGRFDFRFVSDELRARFASLAGTDPTLGTVEPLAPPASPVWSRRQVADPVLRQELGLRHPTVLAVGRLVPIKGHDRLLRACAGLDCLRPPAPPPTSSFWVTAPNANGWRASPPSSVCACACRASWRAATSRAGCARPTSTCSRRSVSPTAAPKGRRSRRPRRVRLGCR